MRHTYELRCGAEAERFAYRPVIAQDDPPPAAASLTLARPGTGGLLLEAPLLWEAETGLLTVELDTRGMAPARNLRGEIRFVHQQRQHRRVLYLDLLPDPWRPGLRADDLAVLAPLAVLDREQAAESYRALIDEAEEQVRLHLLARGLAPGLIHNRAGLDRCHRLLALSLVFLRAADGPDGGMWAKQKTFREQYDRALLELLSVAEVDRDLDGLRNDPGRDHGLVRLSP